MKSSDIKVLSKSDITTEKVSVYYLDPENVFKYTKDGTPYIDTKSLDIKKLSGTPEMMKEFSDNTKTLVLVDGVLYFVSNNLWNTLSMRSGVAGPSMYEPSLARDIHVANRLNNPTTLKAMVRTEAGRPKIFSVMSDRFKYVPNTCLGTIIDELDDKTLGKMNCKKWEISQALSEIYVEFPDKADELCALYGIEDELVPGLYLAKSDIGECSVTVRGTWRKGNSISVESEIRRRNTKNLDINKVIDDVKDEVFAKYTRLPDALCSLMMIDITDSSLRATTKAEELEEANKEIIAEVFDNVFEKIDLQGAIGKRRVTDIKKQLLESLDLTIDYTAYDICMLVMDLPEYLVGIPKSDVMPLQIACGKAPYVNYGEFVTKTTIVA
jgi:hypothetical protein